MVETLDLQDEISSLGATNINVPEPPKELKPEPPKEPEKNIDTIKKTTMDSTPIDQIMAQEQPMLMQQEQPMMAPQVQQPMMQQVAQPAMMQAAPQVQQPMKSKNFMNLTDEQMDALIAGAAAAVMFSDAAQSRLAGFIPNFTGEGGRSLVGTLVSALLVAIVYFFSKRFMNR